MSERQNDQSSSKFYIWSDDLDPDRVTKLLGIKPDIAWRRGDRKLIAGPDGKVRSVEDVHKRGCWCAAIDAQHRQWDVSEQLEHWRKRLTRSRAGLQTLNSEGYEMYIDCHISEGPVVRVDLSATFLRELGILGIGLKLSFYDAAGLFSKQPNADA
jgi:hypothetical protein